MARICRWLYTPGCENTYIYPSDTCLDGFTCTCVKLGNCLYACALEECFESCPAWSHWSDTCGFVFHGNPIRRNRTRICKCDSGDSTYSQINIGGTCWQYSTCETRWETYRLLLFFLAVVVIIDVALLFATILLAYLHPPSAERDIPGFNLNPFETNIGLAEDISVSEGEADVRDATLEKKLDAQEVAA
ncbi:hypothetical protein Aperf_G00000003048 [Anoplocephala perfoliata]